jgi:putative DNA primase/helicase
VTAIETEDGARWAESRIKFLTGGDKIAARFMRCDFFEFTPEFKLVISGNHKPSLCSVDEAIRRRLHLVPFTVTIPRAERDPTLVEKLRAEFPGILAWAIQGCLAWQAEGLNPPEIVRDATEEYLSGEDALGRWIEECCVLGSKYAASSAVLFRHWREWCDRNNEPSGTHKRFSQQLESHVDVQRARMGADRTRGFAGITLTADAKDTS